MCLEIRRELGKQRRTNSEASVSVDVAADVAILPLNDALRKWQERSEVRYSLSRGDHAARILPKAHDNSHRPVFVSRRSVCPSFLSFRGVSRDDH